MSTPAIDLFFALYDMKNELADATPEQAAELAKLADFWSVELSTFADKAREVAEPELRG